MGSEASDPREEPEQRAATAPPTPSGGDHGRQRPRRAPTLMAFETLWRLILVTMVIGFGITAALTVLSHNVYDHEQARLLDLRARDAGAVLTAALPAIQTPLASAAELADATRGDRAKFREFVAPYTGTGAGKQFDSVSLWSLSHPERGPIAVVGARPQLLSSTIDRKAFFNRAARTSQLVVLGLLARGSPHLAYAFTTPGSTTGYAAYAEAPLPPNHHSPIAKSSSFAGLDFALYLGRTTNIRQLLLTDVNQLPLVARDGHTATQTVPFGDSAITLVMAADHSLAGSLPADLPWIIAAGGGLLSLIAAAVALQLGQRRRRAERLAIELQEIAAENRRLYGEQRTIAQTLQHALLPEELPRRPAYEATGRYVAGEQSVDVGGDWYDVIERSETRLLVIVGDVSGRGLRAATTMAALRFATHAYAAQGDRPEAILGKLAGMISVAREGQLATMLCAEIDLERDEVTLCTAGHLPPLILSAGRAHYLDAPIGLPIGVDAAATYRPRTVAVPGAATFLAFTDGLVERRGEDLDRGLERVRDAAVGPDGDLDGLLGKLVAAGPAGEGLDDIAIVGVRWTS